jgi:hypothetical protein
VAQGGVEPPASQVLSLGGLPVAYRAKSYAALSKSHDRRPASVGRVPGGSRTRLSGLEDRRLGRSATGTSFSGRRGSRTLKARRSSGFGPGAVASRLALPFQSRWLDLNQRGPADEARLSYIQSVVRVPTPRPTKKARGPVTPGLESRYPYGSGVTVVGGRRGASRPAGHRGPHRSSTRTKTSDNCLPSFPLFCPPGAPILLPLPGVPVANIF